MEKDKLFKNLLKKLGGGGGGDGPIAAVHVILDNVAGSFKVVLGD